MRSKNILAFITVSLLTAFLFSGYGQKKDTNTALVKIKLIEVVHSILYAPMYVAISKSFFKDDGLEIALFTGNGADATYAETQVNK